MNSQTGEKYNPYNFPLIHGKRQDVMKELPLSRLALDEQERKEVLFSKYAKCVEKSLAEYHMYAGITFTSSPLKTYAEQDIRNLFINNPILTFNEKQQILNIYIDYYNKLQALIDTDFQKNKYGRGERADQDKFLELLKTESQPPIPELNAILMTQFRTHGTSNGYYHPPMSMPNNIVEIMITRLRCFLDYCYYLDPNYDFKNYRPMNSGGINTRKKKYIKQKKRKQTKKYKRIHKRNRK